MYGISRLVVLDTKPFWAQNLICGARYLTLLYMYVQVYAMWMLYLFSYTVFTGNSHKTLISVTGPLAKG